MHQMCYSSTIHSLYVYCAGKQHRSYFRNEAIKRIQNEHNPLVNQHMAMSFACLWITNLWGEFLQMEFSMPCALCFKHRKQTNKSVLGPEFLQLPPFPVPPHCVSLRCRMTYSWLAAKAVTKQQQEKELGGTLLLDKHKGGEKKKNRVVAFQVLSFFFLVGRS